MQPILNLMSANISSYSHNYTHNTRIDPMHTHISTRPRQSSVRKQDNECKIPRKE